jgi:hypothetical protein
VETAAPFRVLEFGVGIALGYALMKGGLSAFSPITATASVVGGAAAFLAGCFVPLDAGYATVLQWPLIIGGLALMSAALLVSRGDFAMPGRALASVGVLSYALLIVNEPLRSITHTMRAEEAASPWVALWVVCGFVPLTFLLARPLALRLGLVDREQPLIRVEDVIGRPTETKHRVAPRTEAGGP